MPVNPDKTICSKPEKPLYVAIAEHIEAQIADCGLVHGERLPSTAELAKSYGVTVSTLQQALSRLVEKGLLRRSPKTGSFIDATRYGRRALVTFSSNPFEMESRFYALFLRSLETEYARRGVDLDCQLGFSGPRLKRDLARLESDLAGGRFAFILAMAYSQDFLKWIENQRFAPVFACSYFDARNSVLDGFKHLAASGVRKIGFAFMGCEFDGGIKDMELAGLQDAQRLCSLPDGSVRFLDWGQHIDDAYKAAKLFFSSTPRQDWPEALFLHHDIVTKGALIAMTELGVRIPEDISLLTHANKGDSFQHPLELCRIEVDPSEVASSMADFMERSLPGGQARGLIVSPPCVRARISGGASVAAPNAVELAGGVR